MTLKYETSAFNRTTFSDDVPEGRAGSSSSSTMSLHSSDCMSPKGMSQLRKNTHKKNNQTMHLCTEKLIYVLSKRQWYTVGTNILYELHITSC